MNDILTVIGNPLPPCFDPRNANHILGDVSTYETSDNPYIHALNYLLREMKIPIEYVDIASFIHGADVAFEEGWKFLGYVAYKDHFDTLTEMLQAGAGIPVARGSKISVLVGEFQ